MRACCLRVFAGGEPWDCLFVVKRGRRRYALYASVDRLPVRVAAELADAVRLPRDDREPTAVDANRFERAVKALECSDAFRRAVVRDVNNNNNNNKSVAIGVRDIGLLTPAKYRLAYTW